MPLYIPTIKSKFPVYLLYTSTLSYILDAVVGTFNESKSKYLTYRRVLTRSGSKLTLSSSSSSLVNKYIASFPSLLASTSSAQLFVFSASYSRRAFNIEACNFYTSLNSSRYWMLGPRSRSLSIGRLTRS